MLRIRSKAGRFAVNGLAADSTLWKLQQVLQEKTDIEPDSQKSECMEGRDRVG